jgi:hypothetical protein
VLAFLRQDLREAQPIEKTLAELEAATCGLK